MHLVGQHEQRAAVPCALLGSALRPDLLRSHEPAIVADPLGSHRVTLELDARRDHGIGRADVVDPLGPAVAVLAGRLKQGPAVRGIHRAQVACGQFPGLIDIHPAQSRGGGHDRCRHPRRQADGAEVAEDVRNVDRPLGHAQDAAAGLQMGPGNRLQRAALADPRWRRQAAVRARALPHRRQIRLRRSVPA